MKLFEYDEEVILKLSKILKETGLSEIEIQSKDNKIRLCQFSSSTSSTVEKPAPTLSHPSPPANTSPNDDALDAVTSPMVGTLYLASQPGATPFVQEGDKIEKGAHLFIIEAMKVMNPIPAPHSGVIKKILVHDAMPVEFGQPLVIIE